MFGQISVAILDDHQGIIDGYLYRLKNDPHIDVVATMTYGEELEPLLARYPLDVLLLDVQVPTSASNPHPFPILYLIPKFIQRYPDLAVLVISMHAQRTLINAVMEAGASGYILKDDRQSIRELATIIRRVASGEIQISDDAYKQLMRRKTGDLAQPLTARQLEALSLCAAYPDASTAELAQMMNIAHSTLRNLLSGAYLKLHVRSRTAAVAMAYKMNLITPNRPELDLG